MSEDYQKGFKDGFATGLEEGKKLVFEKTSYNYKYKAQPHLNKWPTIEEEKEKLDKYNQVWINGQWCHLGN